MDSTSTLSMVFGGDFLLSTLSIILINIVLSGDNSVVIAMAVQTLPADKRRGGIAIGAGAAAGMRIGFTWFASRLLQTPFIKLGGGVLILWIALKLLVENNELRSHHKPAASLWHAIWIIIVADLTMSLDNVLAVAGAAKGNIYLLWFGLGLSIPLVMFASTILSKLMDRYPFILLIGAGLLGKVGGEMMVTDPFLRNWVPESAWVSYSAETVGVLMVLLAAYLIRRREKLATAKAQAAAKDGAA